MAKDKVNVIGNKIGLGPGGPGNRGMVIEERERRRALRAPAVLEEIEALTGDKEWVPDPFLKSMVLDRGMKPRDACVICGLARGMSNKKLADAFGIHARQVERIKTRYADIMDAQTFMVMSHALEKAAPVLDAMEDLVYTAQEEKTKPQAAKLILEAALPKGRGRGDVNIIGSPGAHVHMGDSVEHTNLQMNQYLDMSPEELELKLVEAEERFARPAPPVEDE